MDGDIVLIFLCSFDQFYGFSIQPTNTYNKFLLLFLFIVFLLTFTDVCLFLWLWKCILYSLFACSVLRNIIFVHVSEL